MTRTRRHAVRGEGQRTVLDPEMQVGRVGVPAVTHEGQYLTAVDLVAFMHLQGIRLEVGIEGEVAVTDVYDHEVPELLQQVIALGKVGRRLFRSSWRFTTVPSATASTLAPT